MVYLNLQIQQIADGLTSLGWSPNSGGSSLVTASATAPTDVDYGRLWFNTSNSSLNVYNGNAWQQVGISQQTLDAIALASSYATQAEAARDAILTMNVATGDVGSSVSWNNTTKTLTVPIGATGATGSAGANGTNGIGISSVVRTAGTGLSGSTDTYTITYSNATTSTFTVYNGADGLGSGDMNKSVYDTTNNGKVDTAEVADAVAWTGVTGKPTVFTPDTHTHSAVTTTVDGFMLATDKVKLNAITGTNTGDQDLSGYSLTTHNHTGVYEPADATILKDADIGTIVQAYDVDLTTWAGITPSTKANTADVLPIAGGTMTGAITRVAETKVAMGANEIALASGNLFTKTISGATTLTVVGWLPSGNANSFILELTNGGSAVITWFSGVKWAGGTAPTLNATGVDILGFYSHDGGTTIRGMVLSKDSK